MFDFLALITNKKYWILHSFLIKIILRIYGIKVGKEFYCEGIPILRIRGNASDIIIGNNVSFLGQIDIRNREQGKIIIGDNVALDTNIRLVSANNSILEIGSFTGVGPYTIFNAGTDIRIGEHCLIAGNCLFQSSDHGIEKIDELISNQKHTYGKITIKNNVWISSSVTISKNVYIDNGCILGAKAFVRNITFKENSVIAGIPAKLIKIRT